MVLGFLFPWGFCGLKQSGPPEAHTDQGALPPAQAWRRDSKIVSENQGIVRSRRRGDSGAGMEKREGAK